MGRTGSLYANAVGKMVAYQGFCVCVCVCISYADVHHISQMMAISWP